MVPPSNPLYTLALSSSSSSSSSSTGKERSSQDPKEGSTSESTVGTRVSVGGSVYDESTQRGNRGNRTREAEDEAEEFEEDEDEDEGEEEEGNEGVYRGSGGCNVPSGQTVGGVWMPKIGTYRTH